ncbi:MAG: lamin tail domain-containing protein [Verrucomicrobiales bacterium]|nr:lamin tail domain-containing protein [Verrucomicrobiales bacterium]
MFSRRLRAQPPGRILLLLLLSLSAVGEPDLVITEFMADNESVLADGFGQYPDWIEIHNPGALPVDLAGWRLRDRQQSWTFPPRTLAAGGYLVVFASDQSLPGSVDPAGNLHTDFALDKGGEPLALVDPSGRVVFELAAPVPPQHEDISYGLLAEQHVLVTGDSPARWLVPTGPVDPTWRGGDSFDDTAWEPGSAAVGFNLDPGPVLNNRGAIIAYRVAAGTSGTQNYGGSLGMDFVVAQPIVVTQLGVFDDRADGLRATLTAQLWRRDERGTPTSFGDDRGAAMLAELTFTPAAPGTLEAGSRFKPLAQPVALAPGSYTIVAYGYNDAERNGNAGTGSAVDALTTDDGAGALRFVGFSRYGAAGAFPATVDTGPEDRYAAGTFTFVLGSDPDVRTDVRDALHQRRATLLLRIPFDLAHVDTGTSFLLRLGYDDGFVAWLNGFELARRHAPDALDADATATASGNAVESFPFVAPPGWLREGRNTLAIQGLNLAADDRDFILLPELVAVRLERGSPRYFRHPTPGAPNTASDVVGFAEEPVFSAGRGFYEEPITVELLRTSPGVEVRYTTDASTPSAVHGVRYTEPIPLATTTVLRAVAYGQGLEPSRVVTHTYLFLRDVAVQNKAPPGYPSSWGGVTADYGMVSSPSAYARAAGNASYTPEQAQAAVATSLRALPSLCLSTDIPNLFDPATGLYLNPAGRGEHWERPVAAELLMPDGSSGFEVNAGLQVMGFTSRSLAATPKLNFRLLFERQYGPGWLRYSFFGPAAAARFNSIALRANSRDSWVAEYAGFGSALYLADQWAKQTQLEMGQPAPRGRFVHLYLNGLYWGIYNPTERPDAAFAASYLGGERADFDVVKFCCPHLLEDGEMAAWNQLLAACRAGLGSDTAYQRVQGRRPDGTRDPALPCLLDVDSFIDYALNGQFHASVDWPGNYYVGRDAVETRTEGFKFFQWDNDLAFAGGNLQANKVQADPGHSWWTTSPGEVDIALRQNAEYRLRFADHVYRHCFHEGALTPAANIDRWQRLAAILEPALYAESARWGDARAALRTVQDHWRRRSQSMVNTYFPARTAIVLEQLRAHGLYPRLAAPEFEHHADVLPPGFALHLSATAPVYCTLDGSDPRLPGGAVNPRALRLAATADLLLEHSATVRARAYDGTRWSALHEARFVVGRAPEPGDLIISELHYRPSGPTEAERGAGHEAASSFEFLELVNTSAQPLDLRGLRFSRGIEFDGSAAALDTVEPGGCVVVVADPEAFRFRYGPEAAARVAGAFGGDTHLNNEGERLTLVDAASTVLVDLTYRTTAPWPEAPEGQGSSLVYTGAGDPAAPTRWRSSLVPGGTPGETLSLWDEWRRRHFTNTEQEDPAVSGPGADPDDDGLANALEGAFGSDPRQPTPAAGWLVARRERTGSGGLSEDFVVLRFRRPTDDALAVGIETSSDLTRWERAEESLVLAAFERDANGVWETVELRTARPVLPAESPQAYWRLAVTVRSPRRRRRVNQPDA